MKLSSLLLEAEKAGYEVVRDGSVTYVRKAVRLNKTARKWVGLAIYEDGVAIRLNIDLAVASGIRSVKVMREVLGL